MSVQHRQERERFNSVDAPRLAVDVGVVERAEGDRSKRFAYFADHKRFVVVAGAQEGNDVDLVFALGLTYRGDCILNWRIGRSSGRVQRHRFVHEVIAAVRTG
jgi:hypothetical protein